MTDNIYCVYDRLSIRYGSVFSSPTDATASRQFVSMFNQTPEVINDYELCAIGRLDIATGKMTSLDLVRIDYMEYAKLPRIKSEEKAMTQS